MTYWAPHRSKDGEFGADGLRRRILAGIVSALLVSAGSWVSAQEATEYQVKAAFIYSIAKYVEWPDSGGRTVRLCIIGDDPFGADINSLSGRPVGNRTIEISTIGRADDARSCQILFVAGSESANLDRILDTISSGSVLTFGDTAGFAQRGVIVNFYLENQKVRFEINLDAAKRARLAVSSQVLKLARIVRGQGDTR